MDWGVAQEGGGKGKRLPGLWAEHPPYTAGLEGGVKPTQLAGQSPATNPKHDDIFSTRPNLRHYNRGLNMHSILTI